MSQRARSWIASSRSLSSGARSRDPLAPRNDEDYTGYRTPTLFPVARLERPEEEIDHLVERCGRLVGGLRDHLRVEEADHAGAGAERRQRQVGRFELAGGHALGDDLADHAGDAF